MVGQVGVPALAASSLKAALDLDWDDPATAGVVLARVLEYLDTVEVSSAVQVRDQDVDLSG